MPGSEELAQRFAEMRLDTKEQLREIKDLMVEFRKELRENYIQRGEYEAWTDATSDNIRAIWRTVDHIRVSGSSNAWRAATLFISVLALIAASAAAIGAYF